MITPVSNFVKTDFSAFNQLLLRLSGADQIQKQLVTWENVTESTVPNIENGVSHIESTGKTEVRTKVGFDSAASEFSKLCQQN